MISTVNSLKDLYVKMGGSLTDTYEGIANGVPVADYNVIPDMIEAITQKAGSGGGGGSVLFVEMTKDENDIFSLDKTWKEIKDAFSSGVVIVHFDDEHYEHWYPISNLQIMHDEESPTYIVRVDIYEFLTTSENDYPSYDSNQ